MIHPASNSPDRASPGNERNSPNKVSHGSKMPNPGSKARNQTSETVCDVANKTLGHGQSEHKEALLFAATRLQPDETGAVNGRVFINRIKAHYGEESVKEMQDWLKSWFQDNPEATDNQRAFYERLQQAFNKQATTKDANLSLPDQRYLINECLSRLYPNKSRLSLG